MPGLPEINDGAGSGHVSPTFFCGATQTGVIKARS